MAPVIPRPVISASFAFMSAPVFFLTRRFFVSQVLMGPFAFAVDATFNSVRLIIRNCVVASFIFLIYVHMLKISCF